MDADLYPIGAILAAYLASGPTGRLELRTKSANVAALLEIEHRGRTTVAFSASPEAIARRFEPGTASMLDRIAAARELASVGYRIAFKCEPVMLRDGWESAYQQLFFEISRNIPSEAIDHFSFGCLRWSAQLGSAAAFLGSHRDEMQDTAAIEYRPGRTNITASRASRLAAYQRLHQILARSGIDCPVWLSLEEWDLIDELSLATRATLLADHRGKADEPRQDSHAGYAP